MWHMHQFFDTKQYREDCQSFYGKLLKHCPTFGSCEEHVKFKGIYSKTVDYYLSLFKTERPADIWEALDERFTDNLFSCSSVDLHKMAACSIYKIRG